MQVVILYESNYEDLSEPIDLIFSLGKKQTLEAQDVILFMSNYFQSTSNNNVFIL